MYVCVPYEGVRRVCTCVSRTREFDAAPALGDQHSGFPTTSLKWLHRPTDLARGDIRSPRDETRTSCRSRADEPAVGSIGSRNFRHGAPMITPTVRQADERVALVRGLFQRTLSCWASDLLCLQAAGQRQPRWGASAAAGKHESATRPLDSTHAAVTSASLPRRRAA